MEIQDPISPHLIRQKCGEKIHCLQEEKNEVENQSQKFVGHFYSMMLQKMRSTLPGNPLIDGGRAEKVFQQQIDGQYGELLAGVRPAGGGNPSAANEKILIRPDGSTRKVFDPLARQFSQSLTRQLDSDIAGLQNYLSKLEASLEVVDQIPDTVLSGLEKLDEERLASDRQSEELKLKSTGMSSNLLPAR